MKIIAVTFLVLLSITLLLKGRKGCVAFGFDWRDSKPQISIIPGGGYASVWIGSHNRDTLFRSLVDDYKSEEKKGTKNE